MQQLGWWWWWKEKYIARNGNRTEKKEERGKKIVNEQNDKHIKPFRQQTCKLFQEERKKLKEFNHKREGKTC